MSGTMNRGSNIENKISPRPNTSPIICQPDSCILLSKLPRELRDEIWRYLVVPARDITIFKPKSNDVSCETERPNCCYTIPQPFTINTCRQMRTEVSRAYYAFNTFRCPIDDKCNMKLVYWIRSLSALDRRAIRKIVVELRLSYGTTPREEKQLRMLPDLRDYPSLSVFMETMSEIDFDHCKLHYENGSSGSQDKSVVQKWLAKMEILREQAVEAAAWRATEERFWEVVKFDFDPVGLRCFSVT
ncbi:hypothetical protein CKM354_000199700 [Cercospora kikuchii]|uniref:2EXR domain-containing protein n=1 Tax=Cercospora kikuchii TaxID=84275 RepID=A0A9P3C8Z0_9PEZI|nr:uncharacterized protein CKM354_000199700 [Cercospora kikuchii]GIZ38584.1 hypothetical protein CKM354_000199700 [Cercospora kikuchii]